jgi:transcriptional regulator with PAS, ATPase and Fis domain
MERILVSWVGRTDLRAPAAKETVGVGPIAQAVDAREFDRIILLHDYPEEEVKPFAAWVQARMTAKIDLHFEPLSGPTNFGEIYQAAVRTVSAALERRAKETKLSFHLSPGTPAMAAVWILLAKTRFPAELIESSKDHGVRTAEVPFDIAVDFLPDLLRERDERLRELSGADPPEAPEFAEILYTSRVMDRLVRRARRAAVRNVPVLIEGESGTGKEMIARAIHQTSTRSHAPFIAVNCGAIPNDLVESELFGHEKGAFTGASEPRRGFFEAANGGTLFLDELGELPGPAQVKLLRVIQEGEVVRLGTTKPAKVDVRIIAATNRTLTEEISAGRFREDLFYRLAVAVLSVPPLRDRAGDLGLLIDRLLAQVNEEAKAESNFKHKQLSAAARNVMLSHPWPGNVRELLNTLRRAAIWSDSATITVDDARDALLPVSSASRPNAFGRPLGGGFNLPGLLTEVAHHYLDRAIDEAGGNKTRAADLVGLPSYQTFTNWLKKYRAER